MTPTWRTAIGAAVGVGALIWLATTLDVAAVGDALQAGGWMVLAMALYRAGPQFIDGWAWRRVADAEPARPGLFWFFRIRWIGEAVNTLLPVAQVGGDFLRARLLAKRGMDGAAAGASVGVDFTLGLVTQAAFVLTALALLALIQGGSGGGGLAVAATLAALGFIGVLFALKRGAVGWLGRRAGALGVARVADGAAKGDEAFQRALSRHRDVAEAAAAKLAAWILRSAEIWLAAIAIGEPVGIVAAIVIEAIGNAARSLGFAIPGAIGVQEGGLVAAGALVGSSPEAALAIALLKRGREVVYSAPALALWAVEERRSAEKEAQA